MITNLAVGIGVWSDVVEDDAFRLIRVASEIVTPVVSVTETVTKVLDRKPCVLLD